MILSFNKANSHTPTTSPSHWFSLIIRVTCATVFLCFSASSFICSKHATVWRSLSCSVQGLPQWASVREKLPVLFSDTGLNKQSTNTSYLMIWQGYVSISNLCCLKTLTASTIQLLYPSLIVPPMPRRNCQVTGQPTTGQGRPGQNRHIQFLRCVNDGSSSGICWEGGPLEAPGYLFKYIQMCYWSLEVVQWFGSQVHP